MGNEVREHKDTLFQMAFNDDPEAALSLYNAVNKSNYTDASQLSYEMLDGGFFIRMHNDNGFVVDQSLNLYEHQSTINPNMPLRGLFYFADLYKRIIPNHRVLYGRRLVRIPVPKYIVFYNGLEDMKDDVTELKLSDAFEVPDSTNGYEWTATVFNINKGHNTELMNACKKLSDYAFFIELVREYCCYMDLRNAIIKGINECIEKDIFTQVLTKYRREIIDMDVWEFNKEDYTEMIRDEEHEEAVEKMVNSLKKFGVGTEEIIQTIEENYPNYMDKAMTLL